MIPSILVCGKTGAGKTSLIQALSSNDVVPDEAIGHAEPTTMGFVVYNTPVAKFIDCEGMEPGQTTGEYADFILKEILNRIDGGEAENVITGILYCIDGSGARLQKADVELIKSLGQSLFVVLTKLDAMRKAQFEEMLHKLDDIVPRNKLFVTSSHKTQGLARLQEHIRLMAEHALRDADEQIDDFRTRWKKYYETKLFRWRDNMSKEADSFINWAAGRAAAIAIIPLPVADIAPLVANEMYMIYRIGSIYGYSVTKNIATMLAGVIGGSFAGKLLASFLPVMKIPIAAGVTYGVGMAAKAFFASGMKLSESDLKTEFKKAEQESKKTNWEKSAEDSPEDI